MWPLGDVAHFEQETLTYYHYFKKMVILVSML